MKLIIKSILMLSKEKLQVLSEELNFLYDICNYHSGEEEDSVNLKKDLEDNFTNLKKQLVDLSYKAFEIDEEITERLKINEQDMRELLFFIDKYQKNINSIIRKLKLINEKTSQMFRDGYNQYIPKPTPGRMISNINMTSQVEKNLHNRLLSFLNEKDSSFSTQIIWQYTKSYRIDKPKKANDNIVYLRMSYWYFDLPYLIPALTHEMSHLALDKDKLYKNKLKVLTTNIIQKTLNSKIGFFLKNQKISTGFIRHLVNESLADILSLIHHGNSYLFTMSHELLGNYFATTFDFDQKNQIINIAPWLFNSRRDGAFIRLSVLIFIQDLLQDAHLKTNCDNKLFHTNIEIIEELKELLNIIYVEKNTESLTPSIKDYYKNWHNYLDEFKELEQFILVFTAILKEELSKEKAWLYNVLQKTKRYNPIKKSKNSIFKYKNNIHSDSKELDNLPKYYNDLWELRFKKLKDNLVPHKYELRKKIHFNTIINLHQKKLIDFKNIQPFVLTFYKYKIDNSIKSEPNGIESEYESTFGIYDRIEIEPQKKFFYPSSKKISEDNKEKAYQLKFSLIKIMNNIEGANCPSSLLNVLIQIEIKKNLKNDNTYDNLEGALEIVYNFFKQNKKLFGKVEFFKSLGPKDIIIRIKHLSIEAIYEVKTFLAGNFDRTFSTIYYSDESKLDKIYSTKEYTLTTHLRSSANVKELKLPLEFKEKIKKIIMTTGVMDYTIYWKDGTTVQDIENFYNKMISKVMVSDIQTQFAKVKSLDNENLFFNF